MKAAVYYTNGDPEVLEYEEVADPEVDDNAVLVDVEAISIEGGDVLSRRLKTPAYPPHVVGYSAAGTVLEVGAAVQSVEVGSRVAAFNWSGSYAELWSTPAYFTYKMPVGLDVALAATVPVAFGTADYALFEFGRLQAGETVLVRGATGGVGLAAVQLAKRAGAVVLATTSEDRRSDALSELGADYVINYRTRDVLETVLELTGGIGVDLLLDPVGGPELNTLTAGVRYRGRVSVVGAANGELSSIGCREITSRSLTVCGTSFGKEMHLQRVHSMLERHLCDAARDELRMPIDRSYPLDQAAAAHRHIEQGHPFGRVIMRP
jgi:NADPH2:quinone reductase